MISQGIRRKFAQLLSAQLILPAAFGPKHENLLD
jgi:hypothetical protein